MIRRQMKHLVISKEATIAQAYWKYSKNPIMSIVVDDNEKYVGIVAKAEYDLAGVESVEECVDSITNKTATVILGGVEDAVYAEARKIFSERRIAAIPVISEDGDVLDIFTRDRAFWLQYYTEGKLPKMEYAISIYAAAKQAASLGYKGISVCEFGVAGGRSLLAAQFHAREISRLTGVDIRVYGFDLDTGIPQTDYPEMDLAHWFFPGSFDSTANNGRLFERLEDGNELILGDIKDTIGDFLSGDRYPVGAVFVDVDLYTSTKYILDWMKLHPADEAFLPRVFMYFDDVHGFFEGMGEHKALLEFNEEMNGIMRISPEGAGTVSDLHVLDATYEVYSDWLYTAMQHYGYGRMKICHRFKDKNYNINKKTIKAFKGMSMI